MRLPTLGISTEPTLVTPLGVSESVRLESADRLETSSRSSERSPVVISPPMLPEATRGDGGCDPAGGVYGAAGGGAYGDGAASSSRMRVWPAFVRPEPIIGARGGGGPPADPGRGGGGGCGLPPVPGDI